MAKIYLDTKKFQEGLGEMETSISEIQGTNYRGVESNLLSLLQIMETLEELNTTIERYRTFLENDLEKFYEVGNTIEEVDHTLADKLRGEL
ncbi:MAG: TIGR04197 family type VII secretion effector [Eubacteriales bacterium]